MLGVVQAKAAKVRARRAHATGRLTLEPSEDSESESIMLRTWRTDSTQRQLADSDKPFNPCTATMM